VNPALTQALPIAIDQMPNVFDSHDLILKLAQANQAAYIEALYAKLPSDAPFRELHSEIAKAVAGSPKVHQIGERTSPDIFGNGGACALWRK